MKTELTIKRRVPAYTFVIKSDSSTQENIRRLDSYLAAGRPSLPRFSDSRLTGRVVGSTFELRQFTPRGLGPPIEGQFIPTEYGTDILVQVGYRFKMRLLHVALIVAAIVTILLVASNVAVASIVFSVILANLFFFLVVAPLFRGTRAAATLLRVFESADGV